MPKFLACEPKEGTPDFQFFCPGCGFNHGIWTSQRNYNQAIWKFNGDMDKPTVTPSILVTVGHHPKPPDICHSFITDGKIQFLNDCTHKLSGQTVELPDYSD